MRLRVVGIVIATPSASVVPSSPKQEADKPVSVIKDVPKTDKKSKVKKARANVIKKQYVTNKIKGKKK